MKTRRNNKRPRKHGRKTRYRRQRGGSVMYPLDKFLRDSECAYIKDFIRSEKIYQAVMHFINDVIIKLPTSERNKLLTNLSNVYVLMADGKQKEVLKAINQK